MGIVESQGGINYSLVDNVCINIFCKEKGWGLKAYKKNTSNIESLDIGDYVTFEIQDDIKRRSINNVKLLCDEDDPVLIRKILSSADARNIWGDRSMRKMISRYISTLKLDEAIELFLKGTNLQSSSQRIELLKCIPQYLKMWSSDDRIKKIFSTDESIEILLKILNSPKCADQNEILQMLREYLMISVKWNKYMLLPNKIKYKKVIWDILPIGEKEKLLVLNLKKMSEISIESKVVDRVCEHLDEMSNNPRKEILDLIPDGLLLLKEMIFNKLTVDEKISIYNRLLKNNEISYSEYLEYAEKLLLDLPNEKQTKYVMQLDSRVKKEIKFFPLMDEVSQAEILFSEDILAQNYFELSSFGGKVFYLFKCCKDGTRYDWIYKKEKNILIKLLIDIMRSSDTVTKKKIFYDFHERLLDYVIENAWKLDSYVDLFPLLPHCDFRIVHYCEGKAWQDETLYCPRTRRGCDILHSIDIKGSEISWKKWSLIQFLDFNNIIPLFPEIRNSNEYVRKLGGWLNRLNEIRERIKCKKCGDVLVSDTRYSKDFFAAYNATVFDCRNGHEHDQSVYLSHCWACREIIDSRENRFRSNRYYLCLHCGSGKKHDNTFSQGDVCPKCGASNMQRSDRTMTCSECSHIIKLPPDWAITGRSKYQIL